MMKHAPARLSSPTESHPPPLRCSSTMSMEGAHVFLAPAIDAMLTPGQPLPTISDPTPAHDPRPCSPWKARPRYSIRTVTKVSAAPCAPAMPHASTVPIVPPLEPSMWISLLARRSPCPRAASLCTRMDLTHDARRDLHGRGHAPARRPLPLPHTL
jgi:hypothetical protein